MALMPQVVSKHMIQAKLIAIMLELSSKSKDCLVVRTLL